MSRATLQRVFLESKNPRTFEEAKVIPVLEEFFDGIARKKADALHRVLAENAAIQLVRTSISLGKEDYIKRVTEEAATRYRNDFRFRDVVIESFNGWVRAKGRFEFKNERYPYIMHIKVKMIPTQLIEKVSYEP